MVSGDESRLKRLIANWSTTPYLLPAGGVVEVRAAASAPSAGRIQDEGRAPRRGTRGDLHDSFERPKRISKASGWVSLARASVDGRRKHRNRGPRRGARAPLVVRFRDPPKIATPRRDRHASAVAIGGRAVLIGGLSGVGKSDLALRLIDRGAVLISDDYCDVRRAEGQARASAPATILGKMEIRGVGIVEMATEQHVPIALFVDLDRAPERLPEPGETRSLAGVALPSCAGGLSARRSGGSGPASDRIESLMHLSRPNASCRQRPVAMARRPC